MSSKTPSLEQRKAALERGVREHAEHVRRQGGLPNTREIEKLHVSIAENADQKKGW